jgi:hypothetical protein
MENRRIASIAGQSIGCYGVTIASMTQFFWSTLGQVAFPTITYFAYFAFAIIKK